MKHNHGFTLIEVLVSVLIISTALLGLVGLQTKGMHNTVDSYNRTQATLLASSIADRMRTNRIETAKGTASGYLSTNMLPTAATAKADCSTITGCSTTDMAENDLFEWNRDLTDTANGLAKKGVITATPCVPATATSTCATPFVFTISICWDWEKITPTDTDCTNDPNTFQTDFQL